MTSNYIPPSPTPKPVKSSLEAYSVNQRPPPATFIVTEGIDENEPLLDWKKNEWDEEGEEEEEWWQEGDKGDDIEEEGSKALVLSQREFMINIMAILVISVIGEASRGLTVATLPLYMSSLGGSSLSYTITVSFFSVGRVAGGMGLGYLSHKTSVCVCVIVALVAGVIGNLMYFFANVFDGVMLNNTVFPTLGVLIAFLGRFIVGFGSTCVIIVRVLIAQITFPTDRTKYIGWANAAQFVGSSLLPGLAIVLLAIPEYHPPNSAIEITGYNSPGLVQAFLNLVGIPFCWMCMTRVPPECSVAPTPPPSHQGKKGKEGQGNEEEGILRKVGGYLWIFFNFDTRSAVSFIETSGTILYIQTLQPSCDEAAEAASMFFFYLGLGGFFVFFLCEYLDKLLSSLSLLQIAMFLTGVGLLLESFDLGGWGFIVACVLIWSIGSPISQVMMISSFSRMLGSKPQGKMQGAIASGGSLGRIIAPFVVGVFLYDCWGCPGQPEHCDLESLGMPDGTVPNHTDVIFYLAGGLTFFALLLLTGFKYLLIWRGGDFLAQINATENGGEGGRVEEKKKGYGSFK